MWGGRFGEEPDAGFMEFSSSVGFDVRLYPYDIECTRAWSEALVAAGVITADERSGISAALDKIKVELHSLEFDFARSDEDIHTAIERRLVEIAGKAAGKVRTGRSRNDQVATDTRLFALDQCDLMKDGVRALQTVLIDKADDAMDIIVPGHTHLQQAQPVLLAHLILAFVHMLERDVELLSCARRSADSLPLGSGALAGTGLPVDRGLLAERLGFSRFSENSLDAVGDRDFVCSLLFALSMIMVHLSRLAEQVILWSSSEWGLADLHDSWATGSSLMPQKKNPDAAELVRGKTGRVTGSLVAVLMTLKGLPLSYNRDLQEDKESLFDAVDTTAGSLAAMGGTLSTISFNRERAAELASGGFMTSTDLADYLAVQGMEFPEAHRIVGEAVSYCLQEGKRLDELTAADLEQFSELLGEGSAEWLTPQASVARRSLPGGTAPEAVRKQITAARDMVQRG
jgi:argininosuccinate lyase